MRRRGTGAQVVAASSHNNRFLNVEADGASIASRLGLGTSPEVGAQVSSRTITMDAVAALQLYPSLENGGTHERIARHARPNCNRGRPVARPMITVQNIGDANVEQFRAGTPNGSQGNFRNKDLLEPTNNLTMPVGNLQFSPRIGFSNDITATASNSFAAPWASPFLPERMAGDLRIGGDGKLTQLYGRHNVP